MQQDNTSEKNNGSKKKGERVLKDSFAFWFFFLSCLIGMEQLLKYLIFQKLAANEVVWNIFGLTTFYNYKFAFSLPLPEVIMYGVYVLVMFLIVRHVSKNVMTFGTKQKIAWSLIFAGAISNIGERILLGSVRDYVRIGNGIFNLADGYILAGIVMLLIFSKVSDTAK